MFISKLEQCKIMIAQISDIKGPLRILKGYLKARFIASLYQRLMELGVWPWRAGSVIT